MKLKHSTALLAAISATVFCPAQLHADDDRNSVRNLGDYSLRTFATGEMGKEGYTSGIEVTKGDKVILNKSNGNATSDIVVYGGSVRESDGCLMFCYGEASDGLDDAYIHAVRVCGDKVETITAVVTDDEGAPVLKIGKIPAGWDEKAVKSGLEGTFAHIYAPEDR